MFLRSREASPPEPGSLCSGRSQEVEWIDSDEHAEEAFRQSFRDIRWVNRWLGGTAVVRRVLAPLVVGERATLRLLDVGTGSADIPLALIAWAGRREVAVEAVGLDRNEKVMRLAREAATGCPSFRTVLGQAERLPFRTGSFDYAVCSLTFHHFSDSTAVEVMREMARVARKGVVINDLRRGSVPAALIWATTRLLRMHPLTRHDAPISVRRSRTVPEYRALAAAAGFPLALVRPHPFWRASILVRLEE
jgi:2-polyprenyl-3-methyl-5-hydroxy-6-metoxy-1,4-benzoquinol methylase